MNILSNYKFLSLIITTLLSVPISLSAQGWKAGVAKKEITPARSMWMAGYGHRDRPSESALHPLWAKALALEDANGKKALLVTTDLLGFPKNISDRVRDRLNKEHGLSKADIILNSSHTHTGPVLRGALYDIYPLDKQQLALIEKYSEWLENEIVELSGHALSALSPVEIFSSNGSARFQVNRRNNDEGDLHLQDHLNGPNDYAVPVMKVIDQKGATTAVVFGYACHPTVLSDYNWSGDYPGFAQMALEEDNPGVTAMFFQGAGADQNPLPRRSVARARQYGETLAAAVNRVLEEPMQKLTPALKTAYQEVTLSLAPTPDKEELQRLASGPEDYRQRWAARLLQMQEKGQELPAEYPYPVQVWQMGQQPIVALGGELVVDYSIYLKRVLGPETFVMGYSNDVMSYIPSVRILREGGYEGASSQIVYGMPATWEGTLEVDILNGVIELVRELKMQIPVSPILED